MKVVKSLLGTHKITFPPKSQFLFILRVLSVLCKEKFKIYKEPYY